MALPIGREVGGVQASPTGMLLGRPVFVSQHANNFSYVRLSLTVGTAASVISATLLGLNPRYATAETFNQAAVAQIN